MKLKTPYANLLPPLTTTERAALAADIAAHGVRSPIVIDECGNVLDGHNRHAIDPIAPIVVVEGLSEPEKIAFVYRSNFARRNLSPDQKRERLGHMKKTAAELRQLDPKRWTQAAIAAAFGVSRQAVEKWFNRDSETIATCSNAFVPDARVKIPARQYASIAARVDAGESRMQVAADYGTTPQRIGQIAAKETRKRVKTRPAAGAKKKPKSKPKERLWQIVHGDCLEALKDISKANLIFADPPYNIGVDYGAGAAADRLPDDDYLRWCNQWVAQCVNALADDGSLWLLCPDRWAAHFYLMLVDAGLHHRAWIKWYETFGENQPNNFNRCSRHLFYCVVNPKRFTFNADAVNRPSDRQTKYKDSRANPSGKNWDDVWMIPRLVGNAAERIPDAPTQVPLAIMRAIVGCSSSPGDLVVDPFNGSGSSGHAAVELKRRYIGIEKETQFCEITEERLTTI